MFGLKARLLAGFLFLTAMLSGCASPALQTHFLTEQRGDLATAETAFRQATLDPTDAAAAFNNLAQTLVDRGKIDEPLATAGRAASLGGPMLAAAQATLECIRKQPRSAAATR